MNSGSHRERARDADALALAAGELVREARRMLGRAGPPGASSSAMRRARGLLPLAQAVRVRAPRPRMSRDPHLRVQARVRVLEDDLQLAAQRAHAARRRPRRGLRRGTASGRRCCRPVAAARGRWCSCPSPIRRPGRASRRGGWRSDTSSTARTGCDAGPKYFCRLRTSIRGAAVVMRASCSSACTAASDAPGTGCSVRCGPLQSTRKAGMALLHAATAWSQRGSNAQPGGGASGLETWPRMANRRRLPSACNARFRCWPGRQASRPCV